MASSTNVIERLALENPVTAVMLEVRERKIRLRATSIQLILQEFTDEEIQLAHR